MRPSLPRFPHDLPEVGLLLEGFDLACSNGSQPVELLGEVAIEVGTPQICTHFWRIELACDRFRTLDAKVYEVRFRALFAADIHEGQQMRLELPPSRSATNPPSARGNHLATGRQTTSGTASSSAGGPKGLEGQKGVGQGCEAPRVRREGAAFGPEPKRS